MEKRDFNKNWICRCLTREEPEKKVTLPHDAMRSEQRSEESQGEGNIGWYIGGDYEYTKRFFVPAEDVDKEAVLEFEGVYHDAEIYINEKKADVGQIVSVINTLCEKMKGENVKR